MLVAALAHLNLPVHLLYSHGLAASLAGALVLCFVIHLGLATILVGALVTCLAVRVMHWGLTITFED